MQFRQWPCIVSALVSVCVLSACTPLESVRDNESDAQSHYDKVRSQINERDFTVGNEPVRSIRVDNGYWVATDVEVMDQMMPSWFTSRRDDYVSGDAMTLEQLASYFRTKWHIKINRSSELVPRDVEDFDSDENIAETPQLGVNTAETASSGSTTSTATNNSNILAYVKTPKFRLNLIDVTPAETMDTIAEAMGVQWRYSHDQGVTFYYYETDRFRIAKTAADGGKIESRITTNGSASNSGGESASTGTTQESSLSGTLTIEPKFWENTKGTLESLASPYGRVLVNTGTGDVVVTDTPDGVERIERYIADLNKELSLKAHVSLSLVRFRHSGQRGLGFNVNAVYAIADEASLGLETSRRAIEGASSLTGRIIDESSRWNGSTIFLDALETFGKASVLRSKDFVLLNHSTYLLGKGRNIPYLESAGTTNTTDVGATENSEISEKFAGFGVGFHTRILNRDQALFNIMMDLTDFAGFQTIQISSDQSSDVPLLDRESHSQEYNFRDGQSQVLLALDLSETSRDNNYVAGKDNCLAGCNESESTQREYLLYVMTVKVI
ncbi:MAG: hypothetical protein CL693_04090 [Cellvibrionaceae bacterium]|nr:hypothetical protein [Cellvibrionaceae bacterium]